MLEVVDLVDERDQIAAPRDEHEPRAIRLGLRHQPKAHLRHDAEVALAEQTVDVWPETVAIFLPSRRARQRAHARAQQLAVRQHDLHAAVAAEMIAERAERVADAVIECIADGAAPAGVGTIDPYLEPAFFDMPLKIEVRDARLHEREAAAF